MNRHKHLINSDITNTTLVAKKNQQAIERVIINDNCPIYAYINSLPSDNSKVTATRVIKAISKHLGKQSIYEINWQNFDRNQLNSLKQILDKNELAPDTIRLYLSVIKGILQEALLLEQITEKQWLRVKTVKGPKHTRQKKHTTLSHNQFDELLKRIELAAGNENAIARDKAIFHLLVGCGLRRNELASLSMTSLNSESEHLEIVGKGNKLRRVKIHPLTMEALSNWLSVRGLESGPMFMQIYKSGRLTDLFNDDQTENYLSGFSIYNLCRKYGLVGGENPVPPHSLRRSYATWLYANGVDIKKIAELLGHSSIKTTEIYISTKQDEVDQAVLNSLF